MVSTQKLSAIKEIAYLTGSFPELDLALHDYFGFVGSWLSPNYGWVVYLEDCRGIEVLQASFYSERIALPSLNFSTRLQSLPEITSQTLEYLCTIYFETHLPGICKRSFTEYDGPVEGFGDYTADSLGYLMYKRQGCSLYQEATNCSYPNANQWVADMNAQSPFVLQAAKEVSYRGYSLYDIWRGLTYNGRLYMTDMEPVERLCTWLEE